MPRPTRKNTKAFDALFPGVTLEKDPNRKKGNRFVRRMPKIGSAEGEALAAKKPSIWKRMLGTENGPDIDMRNQPWQHDPALAHVPGNRVGEAYLAAGNFNQGLVPGSGGTGAGGGGGGGEFNGLHAMPNPQADQVGQGFANPQINTNGVDSPQNFNQSQNSPADQNAPGPSARFSRTATMTSNHGPQAHQSELARANALGGQTQAGQRPRGVENTTHQGAAARASGSRRSVDSRADQERYTRNASTNARSRRSIPGPGTVAMIPNPGSPQQRGAQPHTFPYSRHTEGASTVARSFRELSGPGTVLRQERQHQEHLRQPQHVRTGRASNAIGEESDRGYPVHGLIPTTSNTPRNNIQSQHTRASAASAAVGQSRHREFPTHNPIDNLAQAMGHLNDPRTYLDVTYRYNMDSPSQVPTMWSQNGPQARASEMARATAMHGGTQIGYPLRGYEDEYGGTSRRTRRTEGSRRSHR